MNLYEKHILPRFLNYEMKKASHEKERRSITEMASGDVLEIGFGSGLNLPFYKDISKLYALDPSRELYDLAKERIEEASYPVEYIQSGAEEIPLPDNSVDTVISTWSLCSIPDLERGLKEVARVLKSEGKFIFIEHGKSPGAFLAKTQDVLTPVSKMIAGGCHLNREIDKLITDNGFQLLKLDKFPKKNKPLHFTYRGIATKKEQI